MIFAGFGFRTAASLESLCNALELACGDLVPDQIATVLEKADTPLFRVFADHTELPVVAVPGDTLSAQRTLTQSPASQNAYGTGSVCEAAALAAAGKGARLLGARTISSDGLATCALAQGELT